MSYRLSLVILLFVFLVTVPIRAYGDGQPVINEFLPHPSTGEKEWVELYLPDGFNISNYWIDDDTDFVSDSGSSGKKQITTVIQGSDSNHIVFELPSSIFNNEGDTVALFSPDGTLVDSFTYSSDPGMDISIGRTPDATGDFQVLASATRGSPNTSPKPTDTPTPAPTVKPTPTDKLEKPTATQKPTRNSTDTNAPTTIPEIFSNAKIASNWKSSYASPTNISSSGAHPTAILGVNTKAAEKKIVPLPTRPVLVQGASNSLPKIVAVSMGGVLFLGCGILIYLRKQGMWPWNNKA